MSVTATNTNPSQAIYDALNGTSSSGTSSSTSSTAKATQDSQDRFLKLLTTQLKNQDPLNPLDNAQVTSQLAQISTVDGITKLNATLQTLLNNATESQGMQAALLVGHGVLVAGSGLTLSKGSSLGGYDLSGVADSVTVTVKDSNGATVRTLNLGAQQAGVGDFQWDGKTDSGAAAADGDYKISIKATQGGKDVSVSALQVGAVLGVTRAASGWQIEVGSLGEFTMADVKQIL